MSDVASSAWIRGARLGLGLSIPLLAALACVPSPSGGVASACADLDECCADLPTDETASCATVVSQGDEGACSDQLAVNAGRCASTGASTDSCTTLTECCLTLPAAAQSTCFDVATAGASSTCTSELSTLTGLGQCGTASCAAEGAACVENGACCSGVCGAPGTCAAVFTVGPTNDAGDSGSVGLDADGGSNDGGSSDGGFVDGGFVDGGSNDGGSGSDGGGIDGLDGGAPAACVSFASMYCACVGNSASSCEGQIASECATGYDWLPMVQCEVSAQTCDAIYACGADGG